MQKIQVEGLDGETVQDLEHAENFGFTSNPPAGSDCVVVPLGGKTSHGIIVTTTNGAYRITGLSDGETAVYNADGAKMVLKKGRVIEIDCDKLNIKAPGGVNITSEKVECSAVLTAQGQINGNGGMTVQGGSGTTFTGNVDMVGDLNTTGALTNNGKDVGSHHKHTETNGSETGGVI
nr:phage baseplate assembly protein V [Neisseria lactamica]